MKVKELIEHLSKMDQEADVWFFDGDWTERPCTSVGPWIEQGQWSDAVGDYVMREFETPRVLLS